MTKKYEKVCMPLKFIEKQHVLVCTITQCVSVSVSGFLASILVTISSSTLELTPLIQRLHLKALVNNCKKEVKA